MAAGEAGVWGCPGASKLHQVPATIPPGVGPSGPRALLPLTMAPAPRAPPCPCALPSPSPAPISKCAGNFSFSHPALAHSRWRRAAHCFPRPGSDAARTKTPSCVCSEGGDSGQGLPAAVRRRAAESVSRDLTVATVTCSCLAGLLGFCGRAKKVGPLTCHPLLSDPISTVQCPAVLAISLSPLFCIWLA